MAENENCLDGLKFGRNVSLLREKNSLVSYLSSEIRTWSQEKQSDYASQQVQVVVPTSGGPIPLGFQAETQSELFLEYALANSTVSSMDIRNAKELYKSELAPGAIEAWAGCMQRKASQGNPYVTEEFVTDLSIVLDVSFSGISRFTEVAIIRDIEITYANGHRVLIDKPERDVLGGECICVIAESTSERVPIPFLSESDGDDIRRKRNGLAEAIIKWEVVQLNEDKWNFTISGTFKRQFHVGAYGGISLYKLDVGPLICRAGGNLNGQPINGERHPVNISYSIGAYKRGDFAADRQVQGGIQSVLSTTILLRDTGSLSLPYKLASYIGSSDKDSGLVRADGEIVILPKYAGQGDLTFGLEKLLGDGGCTTSGTVVIRLDRIENQPTSIPPGTIIGQ